MDIAHHTDTVHITQQQLVHHIHTAHMVKQVNTTKIYKKAKYLMREDNTKECPQCGITSSGWISGENIAICPSCDGSGETIEYIPCEHGFTETHSYCSHGFTSQHD